MHTLVAIACFADFPLLVCQGPSTRVTAVAPAASRHAAGWH